MGKYAINWLLALNLEFDPVTNDVSKLKEAISTKKKYWAQKSTDQLNGAFYRLMLDSASEIEHALCDTQTREVLAEAAQDAIYPQLDKFIAIAASASGPDNNVEEARLAQVEQKIQKFVRKNENIPDWQCLDGMVCQRAKANGYVVISVDAQNVEAAARAYAPYMDKKRWSCFRGLEVALKNFDAENIYKFALPDEGEAANSAPAQRILSALAAICKDRTHAHNQEKSDSETILNVAKRIFATEESRKEYDTYLVFVEVNTILDAMKDSAELNNDEVSGDIYEAALAGVTACISVRSQAELVIAGFCSKKNLTLRKTLQTHGYGEGFTGVARTAFVAKSASDIFGNTQNQNVDTCLGGKQGQTGATQTNIEKVYSNSSFTSEKLEILDVFVVNDEIVVSIEPPKGAVGFVLVCRHDRFVKSIDENSREGNQFRKQFSLKNYLQNGVLTFTNIKETDYYISVFAIFGQSAAPEFSEAAEFLFSNETKSKITYSIKVKKLPFAVPKVVVTFTSNVLNFLLPETAISYGVGALPVFDGQGTLLQVVPSQTVENVLTVEICNLPKLKDLYLRVAPTSDDVPFALDAKSNLKIS
jgi:hypothetical protein